MARWAIFDVDGTLLPGASMEKRFMKALWKAGLLPLPNLLRYLGYAFKTTLQGDWESGFKGNKLYLKNLPVNTVEQLGDRLVDEEIIPSLAGKGFQKVRELRQQGFKILLMTGSPDLLLKPLLPLYKPDYQIACRLEVKAGKFTGRMIGEHPYGVEKKKILQELKVELQIDFQESLVFANHHSDAEHMELFGHPVAVNPTRRLKEIAMKKGWIVEYWR